MTKRCIALCIIALMCIIPATKIPAAAAAETQLINWTFTEESDFTGNFVFGGYPAAMEWVNTPGIGHGDDAAVKITYNDAPNYDFKESALRMIMPEPLSADGVYRLVAWIYVPSEENPGKDSVSGFQMVLNVDSPDGMLEVKSSKNPSTLPLDEWTAVEFIIPAQETQTIFVDLRSQIADNPNHPVAWYFDNIEMYQIDEIGEDVSTVAEVVPYTGYPLFLSSRLGSYKDFDYELWKQKPKDVASMILTDNGTYQCSWDAYNALFRTGKKLGSTMTYKDYGNVSLDYAAKHDIIKGEVSYLCVYGWTEEPTVEFYVVENYGAYKPPGGVGYKGTIEVDGGTYEVYVALRENQPSIHGTETFEQYFSVRTDKRTEGTITLSEHFKAWEEFGLDMSGLMYEISLCAEGFNSVGNAEITKYVLNMGDTSYGIVEEKEPEPESTVEPSTPTPTPPAESTPVPAGTTDSNNTNDEPSGFPWIYVGIAAVVIVVAAVVIVVVMKKKS